MAALLLMVAWHMANVPEIIRLARRSTKNEIAVLFTCLILTVLFDMVIAISVGVLLASLLFIRTIAEMTKAIEQPAPMRCRDCAGYRRYSCTHSFCTAYVATSTNLLVQYAIPTTQNVSKI